MKNQRTKRQHYRPPDNIRLNNDNPLKFISYVYLLNAALFSFSLLIFYSRILFFGIEINKPLSYVFSISLIAVSLYLFVRFGRLKKDALWLAVIFHLLFVLNGIGMLLVNVCPLLQPPLRIVGAFGALEYSLRQLIVIALSTILNFLILLYIYDKRKLFYA